jgi:hypothetical protein
MLTVVQPLNGVDIELVAWGGLVNAARPPETVELSLDGFDLAYVIVLLPPSTPVSVYVPLYAELILEIVTMSPTRSSCVVVRVSVTADVVRVRLSTLNDPITVLKATASPAL